MIMSISAMIRLGFLAIVLLLSGSASPTAPSCSGVTRDLAPCINFIKSGDKPSEECCNGVKNLNGEAKTKQDRQAICECMKQLSVSIGNIDLSRIPLAVKDCGLSIKLPPISLNIDCSTV